jgi:hypothetical protein
MKLIVEAEKQVWFMGDVVRVRFQVLNDSYEPVVVDRRYLIGPNLVYSDARMPPPIQVEPEFSTQYKNQIILNPWCFYGRERTFSNLPAGQVTFYGYLLRRSEAAKLPTGPVDPTALLAEADPLVLTIIEANQA